MIESLRMLCLLSITENGELFLSECLLETDVVHHPSDGVFSQGSCRKITAR